MNFCSANFFAVFVFPSTSIVVLFNMFNPSSALPCSGASNVIFPLFSNAVFVCFSTYFSKLVSFKSFVKSSDSKYEKNNCLSDFNASVAKYAYPNPAPNSTTTNTIANKTFFFIFFYPSSIKYLFLVYYNKKKLSIFLENLTIFYFLFFPVMIYIHNVI